MNENEPTKPTMNDPLSSSPDKTTNEQGGKGALIGTIIIILLLVVLGIYVFTNREKNEQELNTEGVGLVEEGIVNLRDAQKDALLTQGSSDTLSEVEADVDNTNLENLDAEVQAIEEELREL